MIIRKGKALKALELANFRWQHRQLIAFEVKRRQVAQLTNLGW